MRLIRTTLVTALALIAAPLAASTAPASAANDATIVGVAQDASGKPLPYVGWDVLELRNGSWVSNLQFGPRITDARGRFTVKMPSNGTYRVCFNDDYYDYAETATGLWQPEVRHRNTCWPNASTAEAARSWTPTAGNLSKTFTVKMPQQGLGMAPVAPFVVGTYEIGKPLTVVGQEGWRPTDATFTYQWMQQPDNGGVSPIPGATQPTFTPTSAHNGVWIWAKVTAHRSGYKPATLYSGVTKAGGTHVQTTSPLTITGTAAPGNTLTASYGKPAHTYGAIEWFVDGVPLPGGPSGDTASSTFAVTNAHAGALVEARLSIYSYDAQGNYIDGSNSYQRVQVPVAGSRPARTQPVAAAPTGEPSVGKVLTATVVTADAKASIAYQWMRDGAPIPGATARTYRLTGADAGKKVTVRASVQRPGWPMRFVTTSHARVTLKSLKKGKVSITGKSKVGVKLKAKATGWGPKKVKISYRWLRNGKAIKGATKSTYKVKKADRRKTLKVRITVKKTNYTTVTKTSKGKKIPR